MSSPVTYNSERDRSSRTGGVEKTAVWTLDIPLLGLRWKNDPSFADTVSAAESGLEVQSALSAELDLFDGTLDLDDYKVRVADPDGALAVQLRDRDLEFRGAPATLRYGFSEVEERYFHRILSYVHDWEIDEDAGIIFTLKTGLAFLDRPVYEAFSQDSVAAKFNFNPQDTVLRVNQDLSADTGIDWPATGTVMLYNADTREIELATYSSFDRRSQEQTDITLNLRAYLGTGKAGQVWLAQSTQVRLVWAHRENPADLFLRFATTTESGNNGPYDAGDGVGLGDKVRVETIDLESFEAARESMAESSGTIRQGLYVGTAPIDSVIEYFAQEFLAAGFYFTLTREGKLGLRKVNALQLEPRDITDGLIVAGGERVGWKRGLQDAQNVVRWAYDWDPVQSEPLTFVDREDSRSQAAFGTSKQVEVQSAGLRGRRGIAKGWPDLGWDRYLRRQSWIYASEFTNPSIAIELIGDVALQDLEVGQLVRLSHPGIFDLERGAFGITDGLFYVTKLEHEPEDLTVALELRQRRTMGRPFYISPTPQPAYVPVLRINFSQAGEPDVADDDLVFDRYDSGVYPQTGFGVDDGLAVGWVAGFPPTQTRHRDNPDGTSGDVDVERWRGFHSVVNTDEDTFQIDLPSGLKIYRIRIGAGDVAFATHQHVFINEVPLVEGEILLSVGDSNNPITDDTLETGTETYEAFIEAEGQLDIRFGANDAGAAGTSKVCWIEIDELDTDGGIGFGDIYRTNFGGDPGDPAAAAIPYVDAPGWVDAHHTDLFPRNRSSVRTTLQTGWLGTIANLDRRERTNGGEQIVESFVFVQDGFGASPPPARTHRFRVRRGRYLVIVGCADTNAEGRHQTIEVNGITYFDDLEMTAGQARRLYSWGRWIDAPSGTIDVAVGGGATAAISTISFVRIMGRCVRSLQRFDFTVPSSIRKWQEWGYQAMDDAAYSAGVGYGWTVLPQGTGGPYRERLDPSLHGQGKRWDSLVFTWGQSPAKFRVDLANGFYNVRIGVADNGPRTTYIKVQDVVLFDNFVNTAYVTEERAAVVEVENGFLELTLGDGVTADNGVINWLLIEQAIYYQGQGPKQFGALAPAGSGFKDGEPPYDIGI